MPSMTRLARVATFFMACLPLPGYPENAADEPRLAMAEHDRRLLENALGQAVVGPKLATPPAADPAGLLSPEQGIRIFRLLTGKHPYQEESHRYIPREVLGDGPAWKYRVGNLETLLLGEQADGSIVLSGVEDQGEGVRSATGYVPRRNV